MNRYEMFAAMVNRQTVTITSGDNLSRLVTTGLIIRIELEDGSGYNFNVTMQTKNGEKTVFVRSPR